MKFYPKPNVPKEEAGYTADEIRNGHHFLYADVTCEACGKIQSFAMAHMGKCIKCGGKTA